MRFKNNLTKNMWNTFEKKEEGEGSTILQTKFEPREEEQTKVESQEEEDFKEKPSWLNKAVRGLILSLVFLLPLFFMPFGVSENLVLDKQLMLYGFAGVGLLLWLAIIIRQGGLILRVSGIEWGVLAVFAAGLLSSV